MTDNRHAPHTLCLRADLDASGDNDLAAKEVIVDVNGVRTSVIVVRDGGTVRAYVNSCPHARTPLNWQADKFFDLSRTYLLCATHGAAFDIATGRCVRGPAVGRGLTPIPVRQEDDRIVTDISEWPA